MIYALFIFSESSNTDNIYIERSFAFTADRARSIWHGVVMIT